MRRGKFGSRLLIKLAGIFALVGLLPGLVIYTVSLPVRLAQHRGLVRRARGRRARRRAGAGQGHAGRADQRPGAARRASPPSGWPTAARAMAPLTLERLREQIGASEASLVGANGQVLLTAGGSAAAVRARTAERAALLRQARSSGVGSAGRGARRRIAGADSAGPRVRALARVPRSEILLGRQRRALPDGGAADAARAGGQRAGGAGRVQRIPAARAGARQPAPHVHRHADAGADPGGVCRGAAGHRCSATSSPAAAAAGRRRAPGGRRRPDRQAGVRQQRRARRADAQLRRT